MSQMAGSARRKKNEDMHCSLCGTPVRVVGKTTQHYEPIVSRKMIEDALASMRRLIAEMENANSRIRAGVGVLRNSYMAALREARIIERMITSEMGGEE